VIHRVLPKRGARRVMWDSVKSHRHENFSSNARDIDMYLILLILAAAMAFIGFSIIIIGKLIYGVSWFDLGAKFVIIGLAVIVFSIILLVIEEVLEKLKHKLAQ